MCVQRMGGHRGEASVYGGWMVTVLGTSCYRGQACPWLSVHTFKGLYELSRAWVGSSEDFTLHRLSSELVHLLIDRCVCRTLT